jgi:mannosyltransferase OCH1-like enzyme
MIPKVIHYCWLSENPNDPIPEKYREKLEYCEKPWHEKLKGYEFVLWNSDNFDIKSSIWVKQAFLAKKYAFAADYIRLYAIYNYGGVYMDTDVEVVKPFGDLLDRNIMLGYEDHEQRVECGCFGAEKGHPFIKKCLDFYHEREFKDPMILNELMYNILNEYFSSENYDILPSEYLSAKSALTGETKKTENTCTIHHYTGSWLPEEYWKKIEKRWKHFAMFGNNVFSWILFIILNLPYTIGLWTNRVKKQGFFNAVKHYWNNFIFSGKKQKILPTNDNYQRGIFKKTNG